MSLFYTISRPYAKAIFELALQNNSINKWKRMLFVISKIISSKQIKHHLLGSLSSKYLSFFLITIAGDQLDEYGKNFIKLLAENQRFKICSNILEQFLELELLHKNIKTFEVTSASVLDIKTSHKIRNMLETFFSGKINFIYKIDDYIIDGVIIKYNDTVLDLSVRKRLKQLSDTLNF